MSVDRFSAGEESNTGSLRDLRRVAIVDGSISVGDMGSSGLEEESEEEEERSVRRVDGREAGALGSIKGREVGMRRRRAMRERQGG